MREILLYGGSFALVDDEDYEALSKYRWKVNHNGYVVCNILSEDGTKQRSLRMHRFILGLDFGDPREGDHWDLNKLNNQKYNLRIATRANNSKNKSKQSRNSTGFKGVYRVANSKRWKAGISVDRKFVYLGLYDSPEEAHAAYCKAANDLHGEFANYG